MRCAATGESIPPDSRQTTRPAVPVGQAAGPALLAEVVERLVRQQLDVHDELRMLEIDPPAARRLDAAADLALDLRRRQRKPLVGPPRRDAEAGAGAILPRSRRTSRAIASEIEPGASRRARSWRSRTCAGRARRPPRAHARAELDLDAPHQRAHRLHTSRSDTASPQVAHETGEEPRTVLSLERDLLVVDDDGAHSGLFYGFGLWARAQALGLGIRWTSTSALPEAESPRPKAIRLTTRLAPARPSAPLSPPDGRSSPHSRS